MMSPTYLRYVRAGVALWFALAAISACSSDSDSDSPKSSRDDDAKADDAKTSDAKTSDDTSAKDSAIVFAERVFGADGGPADRLYYVSILSEMPKTRVDRSKAREFSSCDIEVYDGKLYVRDRDSNVVTRWSVNKAHELVQEGQFSFASLGLEASRYYNVYESPTRAYLLNDNDWTLVEWNPSKMELTGKEVSIEFAAKPPPVTGFINEPVRAGDRILAAVNWQDFDNLILYPASGVLIFDPTSTDPPQLIEDSRVGVGDKLSADENEDVYLTGIVGGDAIKFGKTSDGSPMPTTGVLRIEHDTNEFDPSYFVDVQEITKSPFIWGLHRIDDRYLLAQMWDPESPADTVETIDDFYNAFEYIYAIIDTQAGSWKRVEEIDKGGAGNSIDHIVDGRLYVQVYVANGKGDDGADAVVYSVTSEGVQRAFDVPGGDLWFAKRLR